MGVAVEVGVSVGVDVGEGGLVPVGSGAVGDEDGDGDGDGVAAAAVPQAARIKLAAMRTNAIVLVGIMPGRTPRAPGWISEH